MIEQSDVLSATVVGNIFVVENYHGNLMHSDNYLDMSEEIRSQKITLKI